jgi:hypothetical protein
MLVAAPRHRDGCGWLRSFWCSTPPARAPGVPCAAPRSSAMRTPVSRIVIHRKRGQTRLGLLADVGRYRRRCWRSRPTSARTGIGVIVGEIPVERSAQPILLLYLDKRGRPEVRIHGRPRSKKRFLLSAVAPSTSTRHPREARPINWAQRGGLASGREMSPDAEATFHRAIMHAW